MMPNVYTSENGRPIAINDDDQTLRVIPLDEVRAHGHYDDMADLAVIFAHDIVETNLGTWRWRPNRLTCWLWKHAPVATPSIASSNADGLPPFTGPAGTKYMRGSIDMNNLHLDLYHGMFSIEEKMKFDMQIGISLCGFGDSYGQHEAGEWNLPGAKPVVEDENADGYETVIDYILRIHKGKVLRL